MHAKSVWPPRQNSNEEEIGAVDYVGGTAQINGTLLSIGNRLLRLTPWATSTRAQMIVKFFATTPGPPRMPAHTLLHPPDLDLV